MGGNTNEDSLWWHTREVPPGSAEGALAGDLAVDVAILGAGLTGLTAAALLARDGVSVAVLEADRVGAGTSGGTSAHVTQVPDHRYKELISKFGKERVREVVASTREGLERIARFVAEEGIECDFARIPGYLYTESEEEVGQIEEEYEASREAGLPVSLVRELPLPFRAAAGVRYDDQARFHPLPYLAGLAAAVRRAGGRIFEGTRAVEFDGGETCRVDTPGGTVTAGAVIFATHTPAGFNLLHTELEPMRSYVLAAKLHGQAPPDGLFWDTDDPYHYTRLQPSPTGDLLVVGGADHKTGAEEETEESYRDLEAYVRERWPVESIPYRWSSQFYEPIDGLPLIGRSPIGKNLYVATGYSGTGLVFASLAGAILADLAVGRESPWEDLYRPARFKPLAGGPKLVAMNAGVARHFVADRIGLRKVADLSEVAPGQGEVVEHEGEKLAVYRDERGAVHVVSPVCTHAGCFVQWNSAEKTWDCPCHGGRYTPQGAVIEGPPVEGLAPVEIPVRR